MWKENQQSRQLASIGQVYIKNVFIKKYLIIHIQKGKGWFSQEFNQINKWENRNFIQ